ncbi:hypothetical protein ACWPKO_23295 (plasmid) [Coraliomargarita sp. W4R53]
MTHRHHRALRGAAAAWAATIIAATSHTLSGGGAPEPMLVLALGILASPLAVALVGRRLSLGRVTLTVLISQVMFHAAFAMTAGASADSSTADAPAHVHNFLAPIDSASLATLVPDSAMTLGHVMAALLTVAGLYGGERMLRAIGHGIRSIMARAGEVAPLETVPARGATMDVARIRHRLTALSDVSRRGPPSFVSAAS